MAGTGVGGNNLLQVVSGDATLTGAVTMTGSIQVGAAGGSTLALDGVIDDGPSTYYLEIINGPTGRTVLGGSNLFGGAVYADTGFIRATNDNAFGDPSNPSTIAVGTGGTLELAGGIVIPSTKGITLASLPVVNSNKVVNLAGDNTIAGPITLINNNQSFDVAGGTTLTVSGAISGSVDFDKNGSGTLILSGTNTNTGHVNVGDGTLIVNGSLATSNSVFVDGVLGGSGTVSAVTISSIGTLSPGNSPGLLSTGSLAFSDSGSTYRVELDGPTAGTQYDQTAVTGTVTLAGATLSLSLGYVPASGTTYTVISNDGSDAVIGTFSGLPEGSLLIVGATTFRISYVSGTGNDVVLTAVDTPTVVGSTSANPSAFGQGVTYSVTVAGAGTPTGSVTLVIDGENVQTVALADGSATFAPVGNMAVGGHTVAFTYSGDAANLPAGGTLAGGQVVNKAATTTVIGATANPSVTGQGVTFTAIVSSAGGTPTGTVTFRNTTTGQTLAVATLDAGGVATFTTSGLAVGTSRIEAEYTGDDNRTGSLAAVDQTVTPVASPPPVVPPSPPVVPPSPPVAPPLLITSVGSQVREFDPMTGQLVRTFTPFPGFAGKVVTATADLNGDGIPDLVVGAGAGGGPHVKVFDGRTGIEIASFYAFAPTFTGGVNVAAGDVNGDGRADLIVAAGPGGGPHVKVFDGITLTEVRSFYAYSPLFTGGVSVAVGDLDGDGRAEIVTGAGAGGGPHVKAFDGRTLDEVRSFLAYDPMFSGGVDVAVRDVNRDGFADILTGAGPGAGPHVKAFDGRTLDVLDSFFADDSSFHGGVYVA